MGETASTDEGAATGDLANLLAEAVAGLPGTRGRLAGRLHAELEALLSRRLAGQETASLADAGALVMRHWRQLSRAGEPAEASARSSDAGGKGEPARKAGGGKQRKGAKNARGARQAKAARDAEVSAPATPDVEAAAGPLFACFAEEASLVMAGLVRDLATRSDPSGPASRTLGALDALDGLDPSLAQVARLRWFAGLDEATIARLLRESEGEVQRRWRKALAFVTVASKAMATAAP